MKLSKSILKEAIMDVLSENENQVKQTARQKTVDRGLASGGKMPVEEYTNMLKKVLFSDQVTEIVRKQALVAIFGERGSTINALVTKIQKGAQE